MTPQEKSRELVDKFTLVGLQQRNEGIQCAKIAVDEIIKDNPNIYDSDRLNYKYWNEVKQEIEKL